MLEFSSTESCTTSNTSTPLVGFSSNDSSCDGNVALMNDFESTEGCNGQGPQGPDGFSAYQIAVFDGFVGTETQWLASLVGPGVPVGGTAGQILAKIDLTNYNTQWINNFALPSLTSGSVLFSNGTTIAQDNSNFFFDDTNNRLGIGTNVPSYKLHIKGTGGSETSIYYGAQGTTTSDAPSYALLKSDGNLAASLVYWGSGNGFFPNAAQFYTNTGIHFQIAPAGVIAATFRTGGNVLIATTTDNGGKLQIKAGGAAITDIALRIRNSGNTADILNVAGNGFMGIGVATPNNLLNVGYNLANTSPLASIGFNPTSGNIASTNGYLALINIVAADPVAGISTGAMLGFNSSSSNFYGQGIGAIRNSKYDIWYQTGSTNGGGYRWYIGTSEKLTIDYLGNVGIGTTTPASKLHILGDSIVNIVQSSNAVSYTQYYNTSTGTNLTNDGFTIGNNGNDAYIFQRESANLIIGTSNTERLRINSNGNVGINTTNPLEKLQVNGKILVNNGSLLYIDSNAGGSVFANSGALPLTFNTNSADRMIILSNGNVGIGTTAPTAKLHITQVVSSFPVLGTPASSALFLAGDSNLYGIYLGLDSSSGKSYLQAMRNDSAVAYSFILNPVGGNVGIGTTTPTSRLQVKGDGTNPIARFEGTDTAYRYLINETQQIVNVTNGGIFSIRPNEGTTNNPGFDFIPQTFGGPSYMEFGGVRYRIGTAQNNSNVGMYFENRASPAINTSRFTFSSNAPIANTSGINNTINVTESIAVAAVGTSTPRILGIAYTINNTAAQTGTATGIFLNATETALNGMGHNLMDLQVGGVSAFRVSKFGELFLGGYFKAAQSSSIGWAGTRSQMYSPSDGVITLNNNASTDFARLQLGGTTNLFPAIKRSSAEIDFRLADDSGYVNINSNTHVIYHSGDRAIEFVKTGANGYSIEHDVARIYFYNRTTAKVALRIINNGSVSVGNLDAVASALFQIDSTTKGFLPPRMTTAQKVAIATPATGLVVFDTDLGKLCVFAVTWQTITSV